MSTSKEVRNRVRDMFVRRSDYFFRNNPNETSNLLHGMNQAIGVALTSYLQRSEASRRIARSAAQQMAHWVPELVTAETLTHMVGAMWDGDQGSVNATTVWLAVKSESEDCAESGRLCDKVDELMPYVKKRDLAVHSLSTMAYAQGRFILSEAILKSEISSALEDKEFMIKSYVAQFGVGVASMTGAAINARCPKQLAYDLEEELINRFEDLAREDGWVKDQVNLVFGEYLH
jgi:hypothetical protein